MNCHPKATNRNMRLARTSGEPVVLHRLMEYSSLQVKSWLLRNPALSVLSLNYAWGHILNPSFGAMWWSHHHGDLNDGISMDDFMWDFLRHRNTPMHRVYEMAESKQEHLRRGAAANTTDRELMVKLLADQKYMVSQAVVTNPALPLDVLIQCTKSHETADLALKTLAARPRDDVRQAAKDLL